MNGIYSTVGGDEKCPDILAHKYRPDSTEKLKCHFDQATRLKQWIQEFIDTSNGRAKSHLSDDDYSSGSEFSNRAETFTRCALLTGPPGVGKTSLVYTVANELNLHVVESHSSEKRDSKLFSMLKLTNQKGKINAFTQLLQAAKKQQAQHMSDSRRKRRKLNKVTEVNVPRQLSLSGDTSIVLFDDVDVIFDDDGPFLKSLVEFIRESKRPVVLTATKSIDIIKTALIDCEHIHLDRPLIEDCAQFLKDVCKREQFNKLSKSSNCMTIANHFQCDIRQCLNRIHFYGDLADQSLDSSHCCYISSNLSCLNLGDIADKRNSSVLKCFMTGSLVDIIDSRLNLVDRSTLLQMWLDGLPSVRNEEPSFNHSLGEQIKETIIDLARNLYSEELLNETDIISQQQKSSNSRNALLETSHMMNCRIKSRIEPSERDFYTDLMPYLGEIMRLESIKKSTCQTNGRGSRRSKRMLGYLDSIGVYVEADEMKIVADSLLEPLQLPDVE